MTQIYILKVIKKSHKKLGIWNKNLIISLDDGEIFFLSFSFQFFLEIKRINEKSKREENGKMPKSTIGHSY